YHMEFEDDPALIDLDRVVKLTDPVDPRTVWLYQMEFEKDPTFVDLDRVVELTGPADPELFSCMLFDRSQ
ncbi:hypothetical protein Tco_0459428, partial [Tanacetum coccineum]